MYRDGEPIYIDNAITLMKLDLKPIDGYLKEKSLLCSSMRPLLHIRKSLKLDDETASTSADDNSASAEDNENAENENENDDKMNLVFSNYIIVKKIIQNFSSWQELKLLSMVSRGWADVVKNLSKNYMAPRDFCFYTNKCETFMFFDKSGLFKYEPLLILIFGNSKAFKLSFKCSEFPDSPCGCDKKHKMMDYIHATMCYPKKVLIGVSTPNIVYNRASNKHIVAMSSGQNVEVVTRERGTPYIGGIYIPKIPGVNSHSLTYLKKKSPSAETEYLFMQRVMAILKTETIKCILLFGGDYFHALGEFLQGLLTLIRESQGEENPVAVAGCKVSFSMSDNYNYCTPAYAKDLNMVILTVDKNVTPPVEFYAYSRVFTSDCETPDLCEKMKQMADVIPKRVHSLGIKLSCVGRSQYQTAEEQIIRKYFPSTSVAGCFGLQEVGVNCLPYYWNEDECEPEKKRQRTEYEAESQQLFHSYSTVLVLLNWGQLLSTK